VAANKAATVEQWNDIEIESSCISKENALLVYSTYSGREAIAFRAKERQLGYIVRVSLSGLAVYDLGGNGSCSPGISIAILIGAGETYRRSTTVILHAVSAISASLFAPFEYSEST